MDFVDPEVTRNENGAEPVRFRLVRTWGRARQGNAPGVASQGSWVVGCWLLAGGGWWIRNDALTGAVQAWTAVGMRMPRTGARRSANPLLASPTYSRASAAVPPRKPERHGIRIERRTRTERIAARQRQLHAAGRPSLGSHPRLVNTEKARNGTETARNPKAVAVSGGFGAVSGRFGLFTFVNASWRRWPASRRVRGWQSISGTPPSGRCACLSLPHEWPKPHSATRSACHRPYRLWARTTDNSDCSAQVRRADTRSRTGSLVDRFVHDSQALDDVRCQRRGGIAMGWLVA